MAQAPLILKGNLLLGGTNISDATDVSAEATAFKLSFARDTVEVPPTLSKGKRNLAGGVAYSLEIGYLSNDLAGSLFRLLYAAVVSATGELFFSGSFRDGSVSASNPRWCGTIIVAQADLGADAEALSVGSVTCRVKTSPTKETA